MKYSEYLKLIDGMISDDKGQADWYSKLEVGVKKGREMFNRCSDVMKDKIRDEFVNRIRTEEIKAWYSSPDDNSLFQGTSVSSLTIPCRLASPLNLNSISDLEEALADQYIELHAKHAASVRNAIVEDVENWIREGLFYGVVVASKVVSQAFDLSIPEKEAVIDVDGFMVDPHEITHYPKEIRKAYFDRVAEKIVCFEGMDITREELETSLVLADISKPRLRKYKDKIMLAPVRCNEIAKVLSVRVRDLIVEKTNGEIRPKSMEIVIYDTDTPYTYHHLIGSNGNPMSPILPGLTVLGSSGTIDSFRWLYAYRVSLVSQKIQKGSLYSEAHRNYIPFVFFGVLVPRDAEILLDMKNLDKLRYRGNICPEIEFSYLVPFLVDYIDNTSETPFFERFQARLK